MVFWFLNLKSGNSAASGPFLTSSFIFPTDGAVPPIILKRNSTSVKVLVHTPDVL